MTLATSLLILTLFAVFALAGGTGVFLRRASRSRRELGERIHTQTLRLDERMDVLEGRLAGLALRGRVEHLFDLVALGEANDYLSPDTARALRRHAVALRAESFLEHPDV